MVLAKSNWSRGPVQPGVRRVGGLWGHSERQRGGGGGEVGFGGVDVSGDGGVAVTGRSSWSRVGVGIIAAETVPE